MRAKAYGLSGFFEGLCQRLRVYGALLSDGVQGSGSALQGFYEFLSCYKVQARSLVFVKVVCWGPVYKRAVLGPIWGI